MAVSFIDGENGVPGENHRPAGSHWQTLSHKVVSSTSHLNEIQTHNFSGDSVRHNSVLWNCARLYLFQMKNPQQTKRSHLCALFRPRTLS